jgi:hypothetical protein
MLERISEYTRSYVFYILVTLLATWNNSSDYYASPYALPNYEQNSLFVGYLWTFYKKKIVEWFNEWRILTHLNVYKGKVWQHQNTIVKSAILINLHLRQFVNHQYVLKLN